MFTQAEMVHTHANRTQHMAAAVSQAEIAHPSPFGIKPPLTTPTPPPLSSTKHQPYGEAFALMGALPRYSTTAIPPQLSHHTTPPQHYESEHPRV